MNPEQLRAALAEANKKIEALEKVETMSDEQETEYDALLAECEGLVKKIERAEKREGVKAASAGVSAGRQTKSAAIPPAASAVVVADQTQDKSPAWGFQSSGHMLMAVRDRAYGGDLHPNLKAAQGLQEKVGSDGGYLVPKEQADKIEVKLHGDQSLLPKTNQLKTSMVGNSISLPVDESAPWASTAFGFARWEGEAEQHRGSKPNLGEVEFKLSKLTSYIVVTEELLADAPALQSYIDSRVPEAMMQKVNQALISGSGVKMPKGILNSNYRVVVPKEAGQAVNTINFKNVRKMLARLLPGANPVWLGNPGIKDELYAMEFAPGSSTPVPVYLPQNSIAGRPYETLFGYPIQYLMAGVKGLGTEGDLILADLSAIWSVMKVGGITQKTSYEVYFDTDEVAFKYQLRLDARVPFKTPATPENGGFQLSSLVTLADRLVP